MIEASKKWADEPALVSKDDVTYTFKEYYDNAMKLSSPSLFTVDSPRLLERMTFTNRPVLALLVSILPNTSFHCTEPGCWER